MQNSSISNRYFARFLLLKFSICNENICVALRTHLRREWMPKNNFWIGHICITTYGMLLISTSFYPFIQTPLALTQIPSPFPLCRRAYAPIQTHIKLNANIWNARVLICIEIYKHSDVLLVCGTPFSWLLHTLFETPNWLARLHRKVLAMVSGHHQLQQRAWFELPM